jgi:hypothetical protein
VLRKEIYEVRPLYNDLLFHKISPNALRYAVDDNDGLSQRHNQVNTDVEVKTNSEVKTNNTLRNRLQNHHFNYSQTVEMPLDERIPRPITDNTTILAHNRMPYELTMTYESDPFGLGQFNNIVTCESMQCRRLYPSSNKINQLRIELLSSNNVTENKENDNLLVIKKEFEMLQTEMNTFYKSMESRLNDISVKLDMLDAKIKKKA